MAEQLILKNLPFIRVLPAWAKELSYRYLSKTANLYISHGNNMNFLPHKLNEGEFNFVKIQNYISIVLFENQDIIVYYDRSSEISFCTPDMKQSYMHFMKNGNREEVESEESIFSSNPVKAFKLLEQYFYSNIPKKL